MMTDISYKLFLSVMQKAITLFSAFPTELLDFCTSQTYQVEALTMIIPLAWWIGQNNLQATERCIVCPLAFLSVAVTNIVRVAFIKLIGGKRKIKVNQYCTNAFSNASQNQRVQSGIFQNKFSIHGQMCIHIIYIIWVLYDESNFLQCTSQRKQISQVVTANVYVFKDENNPFLRRIINLPISQFHSKFYISCNSTEPPLYPPHLALPGFLHPTDGTDEILLTL